ncbi:unnamed protein product [Medioppia subpectinata]|uniref:Uncharacterized protein n=1 Tax=Medioppia subpectinata TaxID=1979941 RepID=A0A7R9LAD6_9ACAR|nr:unnamed protein product [Medioppia subpectinata]CAG2117249.1 unnamed protein product [Medioppia subpectinata]
MKILILSLVLLSVVIGSNALHIRDGQQNVKDELMKELEALKKKMLEMLEKLKKEGKQELGKLLSNLEQQVELLESQLKKLDPKDPLAKILLQQLETLTKILEQEIKAEIDRLKHLSLLLANQDDPLDQLMKELEALKKEALEMLDKLKKEGKQELGKTLAFLEKQIEMIESQLEKLNPKDPLSQLLLAQLEILAKVVEQEIKAEIERLKHVSVAVNTANDILDDIKKALEALKKEALEMLQWLAKEGKQELGVVLATLEKQVEFIESLVEKLDPKDPLIDLLLGPIETLLKVVDQQIKDEIERLKH